MGSIVRVDLLSGALFLAFKCTVSCIEVHSYLHSSAPFLALRCTTCIEVHQEICFKVHHNNPGCFRIYFEVHSEGWRSTLREVHAEFDRAGDQL